jgi:hypothetical protein
MHHHVALIVDVVPLAGQGSLGRAFCAIDLDTHVARCDRVPSHVLLEEIGHLAGDRAGFERGMRQDQRSNDAHPFPPPREKQH